MPGETANHASVPDFTANDNGYGVSVTRFLNDWGGLEGDVDMSFGGTSTSVIKSSKFLFVGGGPHFALRGHGRVEPWGHVLVGLGHFRFSQTATVYGSNNSVAFIGGLGADFHLNPPDGVPGPGRLRRHGAVQGASDKLASGRRYRFQLLDRVAIA